MTFWMIDTASIEGEPPDLKPFISMPEYNQHDWSKVGAERVVKEYLIAHDHEAMPPDHWAVIAQTIWKFVHGIEKEDIVCAVHKKGKKPVKVYFAEVVGAVAYDHEQGRHVIPVQWFEQTGDMLRLRPYIPYLQDAEAWPMEVPDKKMRQALRNFLPLPGNWFVRWRWLIGTLIIIKLMVMGTRMFGKM